MGSLSLAAFGAVGGVGKGLEQAGNIEIEKQLEQKRSDTAQMRAEAIARLQNHFAADRQQADIAARQSMQQAEFGEQEKLSGIGAKSKLAQLGLEHQNRMEEVGSTNTSREKIANTLATSRTDVANIRATSAANASAAKSKSLFKDGGYYTVPGTQIGAPSRKVPVILAPGGVRLVQIGPDKYAPFDPTKPLPDPKGLSRAPQADVQDAAEHPERILPFLNRYGWVSSQHVMRGLQPSAASQPGIPPALPHGTTYTPPSSSPPTASTAGPGTSDLQDDRDSDDDERVADPYGASGPPTSQSSDYAPAE